METQIVTIQNTGKGIKATRLIGLVGFVIGLASGIAPLAITSAFVWVVATILKWWRHA